MCSSRSFGGGSELKDLTQQKHLEQSLARIKYYIDIDRAIRIEMDTQTYTFICA